MRDLQELLKTQIVSSESTINHALQMNEELEHLRKECKELHIKNEELTSKNESLMVQRDEHLKTIQVLKMELEDSQRASASREQKLQLQLNQLQVSWNSLYDDLAKVRDERNELNARLEIEKEKTPLPQGENRSLVRQNCAENPYGGGVDGTDQAELLRKAVKRHTSFSSGASSMERVIHSLEIENLKQKSTIVKLQTQLKQDRYQQERVTSQSADIRERPTSPSIVEGRSVIAQSTSSPSVPPRRPSKKWLGDSDNEGGFPPMELPRRTLERTYADATPNDTMKPPTRSDSIRRIQEYKWKKDNLMSNDEDHLKDDAKSVGTASTSSSTCSSESTSTLLSSRLRAQSLHPSSKSTATSSSPWGRSPASNLNRENHAILTSHPAYRNLAIDDQCHSSLSTLSETLSPEQPNRIRSLVRWW
jgi:hypothetical protein